VKKPCIAPGSGGWVVGSREGPIRGIWKAGTIKKEKLANLAEEGGVLGLGAGSLNYRGSPMGSQEDFRGEREGSEGEGPRPFGKM